MISKVFVREYHHRARMSLIFCYLLTKLKYSKKKIFATATIYKVALINLKSSSYVKVEVMLQVLNDYKSSFS